MGNLTAKTVEKLIKEGSSKMHSDGDGLYLRVRSSGSASWLFRYRTGGKLRDMGLGAYPEVTLAEARDLATDARKLSKTGTDPIADRQRVRDAAEAAQRQAEALATTFESVALDYIESQKAGWKNAKHASQWTNTLRTYAFPVIGNLPPNEITTEHVLKVLKPIWTKIPETASRVRNRIELVLDAAKAVGLREGENPARWRGHLDKLFPKRSKVSKVVHHPALPWQEAPDFMVELRKHSSASHRALEMTVLSCCRTSEVLNATWDEIDLNQGIWTIPEERMKAGKPHRVPITETLRALLLDLHRIDDSPFLFPGQPPHPINAGR